MQDRRIEKLRSEDIGKLKRKLRFYKRIGLNGPDNCNISRATTSEELLKAYSIIYDCFLEKGFIEPNANKVRIRKYELTPEMATFISKVNGQIVAVMSIIPDTEIGLPGDCAFGPELDSLRAQNRKVCEITNDATMRESRNGTHFLQLTRACFAHAVAIGCQDIFACVSPKHTPFFKDILRFESCGSQRNYSKISVDIVEGIVLNLEGLENLVVEFDTLMGPFMQKFYFTQNTYSDKVVKWKEEAERNFNRDKLEQFI